MGLFLAFLLLLPVWFGSHILFMLNLAGIAIIGSLGLNVLTGYTGQLSIAYGAFMGIGAYTAGILTLRLEVPFWLALPAGALLAGTSLATAVALGAVVAPSSTACVLRVLGQRAELDSIHGRMSLAVLLFQDVAVIPLMLVVTSLGGVGGQPA